MGVCVSCASQAIAPAGTLVTTGIPSDPFAGQIGWDEEKFADRVTVSLRDEDAARSGFDRCIGKVLQMHIFDPRADKPTVVSLPGGKSVIELDMLVAISVYLDIRYVTSLERVSVLEHSPGESFICCLSGCQENVIDGYYRIKIQRLFNDIIIDYAKVQSLTSGLMRLIVGRDKYRSRNHASAKKTTALLASYVTDELSVDPQ